MSPIYESVFPSTINQFLSVLHHRGIGSTISDSPSPYIQLSFRMKSEDFIFVLLSTLDETTEVGGILPNMMYCISKSKFVDLLWWVASNCCKMCYHVT